MASGGVAHRGIGSGGSWGERRHSADDLRKLAAEFDVEIEESWTAGQIVLELFE